MTRRTLILLAAVTAGALSAATVYAHTSPPDCAHPDNSGRLALAAVVLALVLNLSTLWRRR